MINNLLTEFKRTLEQQTGPKFTGYWKAKDAGTPGKKMVGSESVETSNPADKVTMDIPLFLRMMEYAKEDAKTDMDLHNVTERAIELMQQHEQLSMENYNELVGGQGVDEGFGDPGSLTGFPKASWKDKSDKPRSISPEQQAKMKAAAKTKNDERNAAKKQHAGVTKTLTDLGVPKKQAEREAGYTMAEDRVKWQGNRGADQAKTTDHTMGEAKKYIASNYPRYKTFKLRRLEPGFQALDKDKNIKAGAANANKSQEKSLNQFFGLFNLKQNEYFSGSKQSTPSIGYSWQVAEDESQKFAILYYEDRGMGWDTITIAAKNPSDLQNMRAALIQAGLISDMSKKKVPESKIKGTDGKACWDGYRYAGTKNGKDKCVPVKKGK